MITTHKLINALEDRGYEWREYSGRSMYGRHCIGVVLDGDADLYELGRNIGDKIQTSPTVDSMGRRIIAYWPQALLPQKVNG